MTRAEEGMVAYYFTLSSTNWRDYSLWELQINHGWREAKLLAVYGYSFLFEYYMPSGSYLHTVDVGQDGRFQSIGDSVSRKRPAMKWQLAEWFVDDPYIYTDISNKDTKKG